LIFYFLGRISKTDKAIWNVLFKTFNNSGLLTNVLQCLVTHHSRISALWVLELCIVVYKSSKKIKFNNNQNDNCMNCKPIDLDANLVLRTALQSPHLYTNIFLKWWFDTENPILETNLCVNCILGYYKYNWVHWK